MAIKDNIMSIILNSPGEVATLLAQKAKAKRLHLNLSQKTLADRSGVSYGSLKKFEQTGKISLMSLLKIAVILGELEPFEKLFPSLTERLPLTLDELLAPTRQRGRE